MNKILLSALCLFTTTVCLSQNSIDVAGIVQKSESDTTSVAPIHAVVTVEEPVETHTAQGSVPEKQKLALKSEQIAAPKPKKEDTESKPEFVESGTPVGQVIEPVSQQTAEMTPGKVTTANEDGAWQENRIQSATGEKTFKKRNNFLPMHRRIDRGINQGRFVYKGELMVGLTASYGTLSSDDTDFMVILDNIKFTGTMATVKPFIGYFYRANRCVGVRFGYEHMSGSLGNVDLDLGDQNDIALNIGGMDMTSDNYSFGLFHRSYVGLDKKGRFGLFAEVEASVRTGTSDFTNGTGDASKTTYSDNFKAELSFNPGMAVYLFPNVCTTVSIGLGGLQYSSITQRDAEGNKIGSRQFSKMRFSLNIIDINFGVVVHLWDKKKY